MFLKHVLTYRLALYYLAVIWLGAFALSFFDLVHQNPANMALSAALALGFCYAVNWAFAYVFGANSNWESVGISGLIIALIITPAGFNDPAALGFLAVVAAWAMASKYLIAIKLDVRSRGAWRPAHLRQALLEERRSLAQQVEGAQTQLEQAKQIGRAHV